MAVIPTKNEFARTPSGVTIPTSGEFVKVPEGGSGWKLIASGTYTNVSSASSLTIPFPENTTYAVIYVELDNPPTSTAQTYRWVRMTTRGMPEDCKIGRFITGEYKNPGNSSTYVTSDSSAAAIIIPYDDNVVVRRYSSSYPILTGTYNWYIWGV